MKLVLLGLVAICVCHQVALALQLTNQSPSGYKQAFTRACPTGTILAKFESSYSSSQRDRNWQFACSRDYTVNEDASFSGKWACVVNCEPKEQHTQFLKKRVEFFSCVLFEIQN